MLKLPNVLSQACELAAPAMACDHRCMEIATVLWARMHIIAGAFLLSTIVALVVRMAFVIAIRRHGSEHVYGDPMLCTLSDGLAFRVWRKHPMPAPWGAFGLLYGVLWFANCIAMLAISAVFIVAAALK